MPKKDINQTAFDIVQKATGEVEIPPHLAKAEAARRGGLKGGKARAASLNQSERSAIAKNAAAARWKKKTPRS